MGVGLFTGVLPITRGRTQKPEFPAPEAHQLDVGALEPLPPSTLELLLDLVQDNTASEFTSADALLCSKDSCFTPVLCLQEIQTASFLKKLVGA